jgi:hypothetical protein
LQAEARVVGVAGDWLQRGSDRMSGVLMGVEIFLLAPLYPRHGRIPIINFDHIESTLSRPRVGRSLLALYSLRRHRVHRPVIHPFELTEGIHYCSIPPLRASGTCCGGGRVRNCCLRLTDTRHVLNKRGGQRIPHSINVIDNKRQTVRSK